SRVSNTGSGPGGADLAASLLEPVTRRLTFPFTGRKAPMGKWCRYEENEMTKRTTAILGTVVLTIVLAAFTGSALAGDGHGNGNGNGDSQATPATQPAPDATSSPGNSENAPGHNKDSQAGGNQNSPSQPGVKP